MPSHSAREASVTDVTYVKSVIVSLSEFVRGGWWLLREDEQVILQRSSLDPISYQVTQQKAVAITTHQIKSGSDVPSNHAMQITPSEQANLQCHQAKLSYKDL